MESYGAILKKAREEKNLTIEKIARDTSISEQYLNALESEDEAVFPGEPYLFGFLKNYADYLGVNSSTVTVLYKNKKIQECDVPMALLVGKKKAFPTGLVIGGGVGALVVIVLAVLYFMVFSKKSASQNDAVAVEKNRVVSKYTMTKESFSHRVYKGDQITIPTAEGDIILTVAGTLDTFKLDTPSGRQQIKLAEELQLDIDGDASTELIVYVSDISPRDESRGAEISMILTDSVIVSHTATEEEIPIEQVSVLNTKKVLISDTRAYPFTINASFRGACVFRSSVDNGETSDSYFTSGEVVTMTPRNGVRLWMSNGNAVRLQMIANGITTNLDIGKAGQVLVQDIKWIRDTDGLYKVVIIDVE